MPIFYGNLNTSQVTNFRGNHSNDSNTGTFILHLNNSTSNSNANIATHLNLCLIAMKYNWVLDALALAKTLSV